MVSYFYTMDTVDDRNAIIDNNDTAIVSSLSQADRSFSLASEQLDFNISSAVSREKINVDYTIDSSSPLPVSKLNVI